MPIFRKICQMGKMAERSHDIYSLPRFELAKSLLQSVSGWLVVIAVILNSELANRFDQIKGGQPTVGLYGFSKDPAEQPDIVE
jgi:hypothetical protein